MNESLLVGGMAVVTFAIRYSLIGLSGRIKLPPVVVSALRFVPPAVLTAIVVPAVLFPAGNLSVSLTNARLVGAMATVLFAFWKKNLLFTIGAGMCFFMVYRAMLVQLSAI
jgi:branched-subunit amino acid transport protein